ncbi:hypothetical protein T439DRAFT_325415 [Meredithblackwellia eburnea MCA 4105]
MFLVVVILLVRARRSCSSGSSLLPRPRQPSIRAAAPSSAIPFTGGFFQVGIAEVGERARVADIATAGTLDDWAFPLPERVRTW